MTVVIVPRQAWGAAPPKGNLPPLAVPVNDVFLHHEGGGNVDASWTAEQEMKHMRELQADCMARGYSDFPYGVAVFPTGRAYEGRDLGFIGDGTTVEEAATIDNNPTSVAIVWPGNYQVQVPTPLQIQATAEVVAIAQLAGVVTMTPDIRGHCDVFATACPGVNAVKVLPSLRAAVGVLDHPPAPAPPDAKVIAALKAIAVYVKALSKTPAKLGDRGPAVLFIQDQLRSHGAPDLHETATYDADTSAAVHRFKVAHKLANIDGDVCGRDCIRELLKAPK